MATEQLTFKDIRVKQKFVLDGQTWRKLDKSHAIKAYGEGKATIFSETQAVALVAKRMSKVEQWNKHCSDAREALDKARDAEQDDADAEPTEAYTKAKEDMVDALTALAEMATEYGETFDNMNEAAQASPFGQKCSEMQNADLEADTDNDLEELENKLDEAEGLEVPLGFGRD